MKDIFNKKNSFKDFENVKSVLSYGDISTIPNPVVSILMPVYKRPDTFEESLNSALNQDFDRPYEIVVVDNYDEEALSPNLEVVRNAGAKNVFYYRNAKNIGLFGNWNRAIELARSENVVYCHDDDLLLPSCLSRLMEIQKYAGEKCILSTMNTIDEKGNYVSKYQYPHRLFHFLKEKDHFEYTLYDQFLSSRGYGVGCLFNRNALLAIGGYNPEYYPSSDYALHAIYTYYYGCVANNIPTFNYRISQNVSLNEYQKFADIDKFFRICMIQKLHLPSWWLKMIVNSNYRISKIKHSVKWGGADNTLYRQIKIKDKLICKVAMLHQIFKSYRISL